MDFSAVAILAQNKTKREAQQEIKGSRFGYILLQL